MILRQPDHLIPPSLCLGRGGGAWEACPFYATRQPQLGSSQGLNPEPLRANWGKAWVGELTNSYSFS